MEMRSQLSFSPSLYLCLQKLFECTCLLPFLVSGHYFSDKVSLSLSFSNSSAASSSTFVSNSISSLLLPQTQISLTRLSWILVAKPLKSSSSKEVFLIGSSRSPFLAWLICLFFLLLLFSHYTFYSCLSFHFLLLIPLHFLSFLCFYPSAFFNLSRLQFL